jgi:phospholipid N-methyltransferase
MKKLIGDLGAALQFMQTGLRQIDKNASLFPSSPFLVEAMIQAAPLDQAKCVVEFGPGTGPVTRAILKAMRPDAHLHAIELDGDLLKIMTKRIADPRLWPIHGSAADAATLVRAGGCKQGASVVFSSLGLALMNDRLRESILAGARAVLASDGVYVQYQYVHGKAVTYQFGQGFSRFDGRAFLKHHFRDVKSRVVIPNMPPALVYSCTGPLKRVKPAPVKHDTGAARRRRVMGARRR